MEKIKRPQLGGGGRSFLFQKRVKPQRAVGGGGEKFPRQPHNLFGAKAKVKSSIRRVSHFLGG